MTREFKNFLTSGLAGGLKGFMMGSALGLLVARRRVSFIRWGGLGMGVGMGHAFQATQKRFKTISTSPLEEEEAFDEKLFLDTEMRVLRLSGLPETAFKCRNVPLGDGKNYIRTIEMGDPTKPTMVLIHGYGGSSVKFWKIVGPLSEKYHLYMIDIIGMGASSRPTFDLKDPAQVDQYLISWLEAWRRSVGLNKPFILAGHSFGGYLSGLYAEPSRGD